MRYLEFEKAFRVYPVFSVIDIQKRYPAFDSRRLVEWQQKGYLLKIRRGYYCFMERKGQNFLHFAANKIYSPSYVSMESALAYYSLIPETVFMTTSVTTKNTSSYDTAIGQFDYKHIKPALFFGYRLLQGEITVKIAEPEKVILDYLYLNKLTTIEEFQEMRFNEIQVKELIDFDKLSQYQEILNSKIVDKRIRIFKAVVDA